MPTSFPIALPNAPTGFVTQAALDAAFTTPINDLYALLLGLGQGVINETTTGAAVTLSTTSAFASTASVTFTLTSQRRVRIDVQSIYVMASGASGRFITRAAYNSGASAVIGSAVTPGSGMSAVATVTGGNGAPGTSTFCTALLPAGTYTAYASVQRSAGGSATDTAQNFYVLVTDIGAV